MTPLDSTLLPIISCTIKKLRKNFRDSTGKSLSQSECAKQIGVKQQVWGTWESGKSIPSRTNQKKVAELFGVSENDLWQGKTPSAKAPGGEPVTYDAVVDACLSVQAALSDVLLHLNRKRDLKPFREDLKDLADTARSLQELLSEF